MKNVLFLLIDTLPYDICFQDFKPPYSTPLFNYLRRNGTSCIQAISTTSYTTPSVASILTGTYPYIHGVEWFSENKLDPKCMTMAEILNKAGFYTCAMVTGPLSPYLGFGRGFDEYLYRNEAENIYSDFGNTIKKYLDNMKKPWFLFLHLWELHYPICLPTNNIIKYGLSQYRYHAALSSLNHRLVSILKNVNLDETIIILTGDHGEKLPEPGEAVLRNLLTFLPSFLRIPERERTRFWINFLKKLEKILPIMRRKQGHGFNISDLLIRVPLLLIGKDFPKNRVLNEQVGHVDLLPTILDSLGLLEDFDLKIPGRSLLPLINNSNLPERPLYIGPAGIWHARTKEEVERMKKKWIEGLRTSKWKYISRFNKDEPLELYDLENDSLENKNLVNLRKDVVSKFQIELKKIKASSPTSRFKIRKEEERIIKERLKALGYLD